MRPINRFIFCCVHIVIVYVYYINNRLVIIPDSHPDASTLTAWFFDFRIEHNFSTGLNYNSLPRNRLNNIVIIFTRTCKFVFYVALTHTANPGNFRSGRQKL